MHICSSRYFQGIQFGRKSSLETSKRQWYIVNKVVKRKQRSAWPWYVLGPMSQSNIYLDQELVNCRPQVKYGQPFFLYYLLSQNIFYTFQMVIRKTKRKTIFLTCTIMWNLNLSSHKESFIGTQTHSFAYLLWTAAFLLQQSWVVATEITWLLRPKIFPIWLFTEQFCWYGSRDQLFTKWTLEGSVWTSIKPWGHERVRCVQKTIGSWG